MGNDSGLSTTPGPSASVHHGDLLSDLKPSNFAMSNKMLFGDEASITSARSMSLMASQFAGAKAGIDHAGVLHHLPSTAFGYHPAYDTSSVATLANLHAHQHVQPSALYHGHRDQAFSHA